MAKERIIPWNKGKRLGPETQEHRAKISSALTGKKRKPFTETHRKNLSRRKFTAEWKMGISRGNKGKKVSREARKKISETAKKRGVGKWMVGRKFPIETREKQSAAMRKRVKLGVHNFWKGGMSYEPYTMDWTVTLRRSIRERDGYTCQICGKQQSDTVFAVHHIDYNKKNCDPLNLTTLCHSCHSKTNHKRDFWVLFFAKKHSAAAGGF